MAVILDGKKLAGRIREKIKAEVHSLSSSPGMAILLAGFDPASHTYVQLKQKACEEAGIRFESYLYPADVSEETLKNKIRELNRREDIHGILVQLPLPSQDPNGIILEIDPEKDVDGFHPVNLEKLRQGKPAIASAVALGVVRLIREATDNHPFPVQAVVVSSPLFAEPISLLLKEQGVQTRVVDAESPDLAKKIRSADLLITAVGKPGLVTGAMIKPGAIVIDVGTTRYEDKLLGDVDFESAKEIAGAITPVPGGVGPMTVAMLLVNILKAYRIQKRKKAVAN